MSGAFPGSQAVLDRMPFGPKYDTSTHPMIFGPGHIIRPRFDALRPDQRLQPPGTEAPMLEATLEGRRVILAQPDYATSGKPYGYTIPITTSRLRRARDLELDRASRSYDPSAIEGFGEWTIDDRILVAKLTMAGIAAIVGWHTAKYLAGRRR